VVASFAKRSVLALPSSARARNALRRRGARASCPFWPASCRPADDASFAAGSRFLLPAPLPSAGLGSPAGRAGSSRSPFNSARSAGSAFASLKPAASFTPRSRLAGSWLASSAVAASARKGVSWAASSLVRTARSASSAAVRVAGFCSVALSASPTPGSPGNCASRSTSSCPGARVSFGKSCATRAALAFGSSASVASRRASVGSFSASFESRNFATASGCFSRNIRTR